MMKFMPALNLALGAFFVLPVVSQDKPLGGGLETALANSISSLENLSTIRRDLSDGEVAAVQRLITATEGPLLEGPQREERLRKLRLDVNRLQMTLDQLDSGGEEGLLVHTPEITLRSGPGGLELHGRELEHPPTAGLDAATRDLVRAALPRGSSNGGQSGRAQAPRKRKLESAEDFSASRLREGRLLYKAELFEKALKLLQTLPTEDIGDGWEAKYWIGRCLEKLGREEEAIKQYSEITAAGEKAGGFAQSAKQDYDFLVWKREFSQRRSQGKNQ